MLKKLFQRFFGWQRKYVFPRWFHEELQGNLKVLVGQDLSPEGIPEVVVQLLSRSNFGKWKTIGTFRYLDTPSLKVLLQKTDTYMRGIILHD
ncbi:MAG: hypothetical protein QM775_25700 [Pirellulales bacterium]